MKPFCQKLTQKGYKHTGKNAYDAETFKGRYIGRNVELAVYQDEGVVCSVHVNFMLESKKETYDLQEKLLGALRLKYPRLQDSTDDSGTFTDEYGEKTEQYVTYVPRESRGTINWRNLLGQFIFQISDIPMGTYSYLLEFTYVDEYNLPEWRAERKIYLRNKKTGMEL